jgi:hypothetical protein
MKMVSLALGLLLLVHVSAYLGVEPNEQCNWRGFKTCPIESAGSSPLCDATNPTEISPGLFALKICAGETPKFVGGKF